MFALVPPAAAGMVLGECEHGWDEPIHTYRDVPIVLQERVLRIRTSDDEPPHPWFEHHAGLTVGFGRERVRFLSRSGQRGRGKRIVRCVYSPLPGAKRVGGGLRPPRELDGIAVEGR